MSTKLNSHESVKFATPTYCEKCGNQGARPHRDPYGNHRLDPHSGRAIVPNICFVCQPHTMEEMLGITAEESGTARNVYEEKIRERWERDRNRTEKDAFLAERIRSALFLSIFKRKNTERATKLAELPFYQIPPDAFFIKMMKHERKATFEAYCETAALWVFLEPLVRKEAEGGYAVTFDLVRYVDFDMAKFQATAFNARKVSRPAPPLLPVSKTSGIGPMGRR